MSINSIGFGQARTFVELWLRRFMDLRCPGGLKGKMAPGDAHPYLALFCFSVLLTRYII